MQSQEFKCNILRAITWINVTHYVNALFGAYPRSTLEGVTLKCEKQFSKNFEHKFNWFCSLWNAYDFKLTILNKYGPQTLGQTA